MHNLVLYCKTYKNDYQSFCRLLESIIRYNSDNIPLYVSVPTEDLALFSQHSTPNVTYITDESYMEQYKVKPRSSGLSKGYLDMEVCKLSFHETGFCKNYVCLDSDYRFIRPFFVKDFMHDEDTPYIILVMDRDLLIERHYQEFGNSRQNFIKKIYEAVGLEDDRRLRTCHGMQVMSCLVLNSLKQDFMTIHNYTYESLLDISPFEFTWYNAWFQKCKLVPEYAVEPFFKMFHMRIEYVFSKVRKIRLEDLAQQYVGIVLNGNWRPTPPPLHYGKISLLDKILYRLVSKL